MAIFLDTQRLHHNDPKNYLVKFALAKFNSDTYSPSYGHDRIPVSSLQMTPHDVEVT
jgi:hypothetical protein